MGVGVKRRGKRSRAEWTELLARFEASGLSGAAFCEREGISKSSFARWKRLVGAPLAEVKSEFVEWSAASAPSTGAPTLASGELELSFPGGVRLRFRP